MKRIKLVFAMAIASLLVLTLPATGSVWRFDGDNATYGNVHFSIGDPGYGSSFPGVIFTFNKDEPFTSRQLCTDDFEGSCLQIPENKMQLQAMLYMPVCEGNGVEQICVAGLAVGGDDKSLVPATFIRYLNYEIPPFGGPYDLPKSRAPSVWEVDVAGQTLTYLVTVGYNYIYSSNGAWENMFVGVAPVRWVPGSFPKISRNETLFGRDITPWASAGCLSFETNGCYKIDYPATKKEIALDLITEFSSPLWITGRMANSSMDFLDLPGKFQKVRVQGEEVDVFGAGVTLPTEQYNSLLGEDLELLPNLNRSAGFEGSDARAFSALEKLGTLMGDKARGFNRQWGFSAGLISYASQCVKESEGIIGYVTTDAMVYEPGAPSFDGAYFSYRVAGLHLDPQSEPILGSYEFGISNDLARCLYGFNNSPVSATVSVFGSSGDQKVATTLVSSRNDWTHLSAKGFTFSENQIKVQLRKAGASQIKTLTSFTSSALSSKQKAEIRSVLAKSDGNTKFICTGIRYFDQPMSDNVTVRKRAKAACDYAKSINPNFSYWYQTKTTQARSYNGKVMIVSKN
jgi:hypothetical protein